MVARGGSESNHENHKLTVSEFDRNAYYRPHSHDGLTTHLIIQGELTITYPADKSPEKTTPGVGERIDVEAGRTHEVWIGKEGCTYVIGEQ